MNEIGRAEIRPTLIKYMFEMKSLEFEYSKIPNWRWIKQFRNIKERETLTRLFMAKTRKWDM
jgi:hypothetical protein